MGLLGVRTRARTCAPIAVLHLFLGADAQKDNVSLTIMRNTPSGGRFDASIIGPRGARDIADVATAGLRSLVLLMIKCRVLQCVGNVRLKTRRF